MEKPLGRHLLIDMWLDEQNIDKAVSHITHTVRQQLTVVNECEHNFDPYGLTKIFILSESHVTLHTYPECGFISIDLYICAPEFDLTKFQQTLSDKCVPTLVNAKLVARGNPAGFYNISPAAEVTGSTTIHHTLPVARR